MAVILPKFADEERVKEDIGETGTTNIRKTILPI